jgi:hypothetical protein
MASSIASDANYGFTTLVDECQLLDENFAILKPGNFAPALWSERTRSSLLGVLDPSWDGLRTTKGARFRVALLTACACAFIAPREGRAPADCVGALCAGIGAIKETIGHGPRAEAAIEKLINKTFAEARESLGSYGRGGNDEAACEAIFTALIEAATPAQREKMAKRLLPPWQLAVDPSTFVAAGLFARAYARLFSLGADLSDLFAVSPTAEESVADQVKRKIDAMPAGDIKAALLSAFEKKTLNVAPIPTLERNAEAWEARGVSKAQLGELLNLIATLGEKTGGDGVREALSWLREHPQLVAERQTLQEKKENVAALKAIGAAGAAKKRL